MSSKTTGYKLTKADFQQINRRNLVGFQAGWNYERMQHSGYLWIILPQLRKIYGDDTEALKTACRTQCSPFFNTSNFLNTIITGIDLAIEETDGLEGMDTVASLKTGLMGPLAGVGDTVDFGTVQVILFALGASFATQGNAFGVVFVILFGILTFIEARALFGLGYKLGRESVQKILAGGIVNKLIDCASIVGMFVMGALSASIVKVSTPLSWTFGEKTIVLQDTLNSIAPGLLALAAVMFVFWGIKYKKWTITKLLVILIVVSLVGAFLGILTA